MLEVKLYEIVKVRGNKLAIRSEEVPDGINVIATMEVSGLTLEKDKTYPEGDATIQRRQEVFLLLDDSLRNVNMSTIERTDLFENKQAPLLNRMYKKLKIG